MRGYATPILFVAVELLETVIPEAPAPYVIILPPFSLVAAELSSTHIPQALVPSVVILLC